MNDSPARQREISHGHNAGFVVVGEALVDIVVPHGGGDREVKPGGSPMNVAVGLARLGVPATLVTQLGEDSYGDAVRQHLEASGVRLEVSPTTSRAEPRTSTATAYLDASGAATYDFDLDWSIAPCDLPTGTSALHLGSLGAALRPGREAALELAHQAHAAGLMVTFDPNARPSITSDSSQAWADVVEAAQACSLVKLSDEDLDFYQPGVSFAEAAQTLLACGPSLVVITSGGGGAAAFTNQGATETTSRPVEVVDTVGAGDSFMAALVCIAATHGLGELDTHRVRAYVSAAHEAAAITVSRRGANPPWRHELGEGWPHL